MVRLGSVVCLVEAPASLPWSTHTRSVWTTYHRPSRFLSHPPNHRHQHSATVQGQLWLAVAAGPLRPVLVVVLDGEDQKAAGHSRVKA
jgi:hypothetical protein